MSENIPPAAAVESMLKTRTELGDVGPCLSPPLPRTTKGYPRRYHVPGAGRPPGSIVSVGMSAQRYSPPAQPRGLRYPAENVHGRAVYRVNMAPSQGSVGRRYVGTTYLCGHVLPANPAPRRQPSYSSLGSSRTHHSAKGPLTSHGNVRDFMPLAHRTNQPVASDVTRIYQPGIAVESMVPLRAAQPSPYYGDRQTRGYNYDTFRLPGSFPESPESSARPSRRGATRRPFDLSTSASPSSGFRRDSPVHRLPPAAPEQLSRDDRGTSPLYYDYTEGFGEDEFFSTKGSSVSSTSHRTRQMVGSARSQHFQAHAHAMPQKIAGISPTVSGKSSERSFGPLSDRTASATYEAGTKQPRDDYSPGKQKQRADADQYHSESSVQFGQNFTQYSSSLESEIRSQELASKSLDPGSYSSSSGRPSQAAKESSGSSGNWQRIENGSKRSDSDGDVLFAADSMRPEEHQDTDNDTDLNDGTASEIAWRKAHLESEQHDGILAELNMFGVNARSYRQVHMSHSVRYGEGRASDDQAQHLHCSWTRSSERLGFSENPVPGPLRSSVSPPSAEIRDTPTEEQPTILSKASFPWLAKADPAVTANLSETSLSPPLQRMSSQASRSPEPHMLRVVNASTPLLPIPTRGHGSVASLGGRGSIMQTPPKFKLRLQRSCAGQSVSSFERRPWNVDENYPWAGLSPDVRVDLPDWTSRDPSPVKERKFRLRLPRRSKRGSRNKRRGSQILADTEDSATTANDPTENGLRGMGYRNGEPSGMRSEASDAPRLPSCMFSDHGISPSATWSGAVSTANNSQEPSPSSGLVRAENPLEMHSVFSNDSSDAEAAAQPEPRQLSVRDRFSSLRARFAASRAFDVRFRENPRSSNGLESEEASSPAQSRSKDSRDDDLAADHPTRFYPFRPHHHHDSHDDDDDDHAQDDHEHVPHVKGLRQKTLRAGRAVAGKLRRWVARRREQVSRLRRRRSAVAL